MIAKEANSYVTVDKLSGDLVYNYAGMLAADRVTIEGAAACSRHLTDPGYMSRKFKSFERINSILEINGSFHSCNSCKRLGTSRLHELHESKIPFVSRIEFIRSKLSNYFPHVSGVISLRAAFLLPPGNRLSPPDLDLEFL